MHIRHIPPLETTSRKGESVFLLAFIGRYISARTWPPGDPQPSAHTKTVMPHLLQPKIRRRNFFTNSLHIVWEKSIKSLNQNCIENLLAYHPKLCSNNVCQYVLIIIYMSVLHQCIKKLGGGKQLEMCIQNSKLLENELHRITGCLHRKHNGGKSLQRKHSGRNELASDRMYN
jgi:hypothetical protein